MKRRLTQLWKTRGAYFQTVKHLFEDTFYYEVEISTQMTGKGENLLINCLEKDALQVKVKQLSQEVGQPKEVMKMMQAKTYFHRPLEPYHYFFGIGEFKDGSEALF